MPAFSTLNTNQVYTALKNMIIDQIIVSDNIASGYTALVDAARVDGSRLGDQRLYYDTDALTPYPFVMDADYQLNVLKTHRNQRVSVQAIVINQARQIPVTIDNYFTPRAFQTNSSFVDFNGVMIQWLSDTKKIYDQTTYNTYIGTATATGAAQTITVDAVDTTLDSEAQARQRGEILAQAIADLMSSLKDVSRDYNDYEYLRSYDPADLIVVWNAETVNRISKRDLPSIFHDDIMGETFSITNAIPARYFGNINATSGTTAATNTTVRSLVDTWYGTAGEINWSTYTPDTIPAGYVHVFAGDLLPNSTPYGAGRTYTEDADIVCKVMAKNSVPYMSGFEVSTDFMNGRNLSENHYLTFAHNTLEYLKGKPFITIKEP